MNEELSPNHKSKQEHGTIESYIIGFVLSLIFTIIPYYLVVNETISGNSLLVTILGIGVVQMFIQIFFFLHLGRGPKPLYNVVFFFATAGIIVIVVGASLMIMSNLYRNMLPGEVTIRIAQEESISQVSGEDTGACKSVNDSHIVRIKNGRVTPASTLARLCDALSFINEDSETREIVFGAPPERKSYGGLFEVNVRSGRPEVIMLNETGTFTFRDSKNPGVTAQFTVKE